MQFVVGLLIGAVVSPAIMVWLARREPTKKPDYISNWDKPERQQMMRYDRTGDSVV